MSDSIKLGPMKLSISLPSGPSLRIIGHKDIEFPYKDETLTARVYEMGGEGVDPFHAIYGPDYQRMVKQTIRLYNDIKTGPPEGISWKEAIEVMEYDESKRWEWINRVSSVQEAFRRMESISGKPYDNNPPFPDVYLPRIKEANRRFRLKTPSLSFEPCFVIKLRNTEDTSDISWFPYLELNYVDVIRGSNLGYEQLFAIQRLLREGTIDHEINRAILEAVS